MTGNIAKSITSGRREAALEPGESFEPGVWLLVFGEMSLFIVLFASYLWDRRENLEGFAAVQHEFLHPNLALINTILLLSSSYFVARAVAHARRGQGSGGGGFLAAVVCGAGFVILKTAEYITLGDSVFAIGHSGFSSYYYIITITHFCHILIGLSVLLVLYTFTRLQKPIRADLMECGTCYWHMVDAVWIIIFPLLYLL